MNTFCLSGRLPRDAFTMPACPVCDALMVRVTYPSNHDRATVTLYRCTACPAERDHQVETIPELRDGVTA